MSAQCVSRGNNALYISSNMPDRGLFNFNYKFLGDNLMYTSARTKGVAGS